VLNNFKMAAQQLLEVGSLNLRRATQRSQN